MDAIKFKKPYAFEGQEYTEIDLSGLEKLTIKDLAAAQKRLASNALGSKLTEFSTAGASEIAARATGKPIEFFDLLPPYAVRAVRAAVTAAVTAAKDDGGFVLRLSAAYKYNGQKYTEVDMSGAADITGLDMQQAENKLAGEGVITDAPEANYYYCCLLASRASGLPTDFFLGLPISEAVALKGMVNSDRFFA